jgi:hypothetical protein
MSIIRTHTCTRSPTLSELTLDVHIGDDDDEFEEGKGEVYSFCTVLKSLT